ncbi:tail fiber assembly protein [Rahnella victoriana]|uniref:Tail fiber assembly protein n=1 Tax=Rahnella victoriana TaxID=1510570 RepID=A0ABS0DWU9_9GAMM|nr:tail fiber assembly protein [Rahnella victoriana]MBF7958300.1 tail fiber assembly protein [Rahnella victoriana]UHM88906.1 tail fiber assembly protein [Rahnella victoriana]
MIIFKNIKITKQAFEEGLTLPIIYFEDQGGNDWYELRDREWKGKNHFITLGKDKVVRTWAKDPNFLTLSEGVTIIEINKERIPKDIIDHRYMFVNGEFSSLEPSVNELAEKERNLLLASSLTILAPLQDAWDLGVSTEEEKTLLKAWKTYRVALNRLDLSTAPDITWPDIPA